MFQSRACVCTTSCYWRTLTQWREAEWDLGRGRGCDGRYLLLFQCKVITRGDESENVIITGHSPICDVRFCREISGSCSAALRGINTPCKQKNVCFGTTNQMVETVMLICCRKKLGDFYTISKKNLHLCIMYFCVVLWDSCCIAQQVTQWWPWRSAKPHVYSSAAGFQPVAAAIEEQTTQSLSPGVPDLNGHFSQNWNFTHLLLTTWFMEGVDIS